MPYFIYTALNLTYFDTLGLSTGVQFDSSLLEGDRRGLNKRKVSN
jgi:hypothetical protein